VSHELIAVLTADWHIRRMPYIWADHPDLVGDIDYGIRQVANIVEQLSPRAVVLAGDIFNEKLQRSTALATMQRFLSAADAASCRVLYVQGQHELSQPPIISTLSHAATHLTDTPIEVGNLAFAGLDYQHPSEVVEAVGKVAAADVFVTHQVWKDLMGDVLGDVWLDACQEHRLIVSGDFHCGMYREFGSKCLPFVSPGPLCRQKINENAPKRVYLLYDDLHVEPRRLLERQCFMWYVNSEADLDSLLARWDESQVSQPQPHVPPEIEKNIVWVQVRADIPDAVELIRRRAGDSVHLFISVSPPEQGPAVAIPKDKRDHIVAGGGKEALLRGLAELYRDDEAVYQNAVRLVRAADPVTEAKAIFEELVGETSET